MSRWILLLAFCGVLFFHGLTTGELYRTEGLRARIAAECYQSGNWIVPTLYSQPLFTKPPGMYSAIGLASWPFGGITDWSARLPSAIAATALVLLFYWFFSRQFGRSGGLVAALLLPLSPMWLERVPTAEIDALQTVWAGLAILFFLRALEADDVTTDSSFIVHRSSFPYWLLALLCVAGGFLTKWTAPAFFYMTVVPLLIWRGEWRLLLGWRHLVALLIAVSVCIGWVIAAGASAGWDVLYQTVSAEALQHLSPAHQHEPYPWAEALTFPFRILAANLPLSAFAIFTLRRGFMERWNPGQQRVLQAMHCWVWPSLIFWSLIPGHAVRHSFPLSPGLAGLAAVVWIGWLRASPRRKETTDSTDDTDKEATASLHPCHPCHPWLAFDRRAARWHYRSGKLARLGRSIALPMLVAIWLIVKVVHIEFIVPPRSANRQPQAKGELLALLVPRPEPLYLVQVKDEGLMFYYGGPVRRLANFGQLSSLYEPLYCILTEAEWRAWPATRPAQLVQRLTDQQGDPLILVKVTTDDARMRASRSQGVEGQ
jgi:hypothetical protein